MTQYPPLTTDDLTAEGLRYIIGYLTPASERERLHEALADLADYVDERPALRAHMITQAITGMRAEQAGNDRAPATESLREGEHPRPGSQRPEGGGWTHESWAQWAAAHPRWTSQGVRYPTPNLDEEGHPRPAE